MTDITDRMQPPALRSGAARGSVCDTGLGSMSSLRILIADDHDLLRRGLKSLIESQLGWTICAEVRTGREAVASADALKPDVAILDITMPELDGIEAAKRIRSISPKTEILMLSAHYSEQLIRAALVTGAHGFVVKSDCNQELVIAIQTLSQHKPFVTTRATEMMLGDFKSDGRDGGGQLTPREIEMVQFVCEGKTCKEIAYVLGIKAKTVETHRANVMRKLGFHSVGELVRYAVRNHIIEP